MPVVRRPRVPGSQEPPSPPWLQERLTAIGCARSRLVDITNFVTMDLGRPLHVFDAAKLRGDLVLRFARPGEYCALTARPTSSTRRSR